MYDVITKWRDINFDEKKDHYNDDHKKSKEGRVQNTGTKVNSERAWNRTSNLGLYISFPLNVVL